MKQIILSLALAAQLTGCADDVFSITTINTLTAPTSVATMTFVTNSGDEFTTGTDSTLGTDGVSSTDGSSDTTAATVSDDTQPTTGDPVEPISDPPVGCAHFVEVLGRAAPAGRYIAVDASGCPRGSVLSLKTFIGGDSGGEWLTDLGVALPCAVYGGADSPAASDPNGVVVMLDGPVEEPNSYVFTLMADGVISDDIRVPAILQGLVWPEQPSAPLDPLRRREGWTWSVATDHVTGCVLN